MVRIHFDDGDNEDVDESCLLLGLKSYEIHRSRDENQNTRRHTDSVPVSSRANDINYGRNSGKRRISVNNLVSYKQK